MSRFASILSSQRVACFSIIALTSFAGCISLRLAEHRAKTRIVARQQAERVTGGPSLIDDVLRNTPDFQHSTYFEPAIRDYLSHVARRHPDAPRQLIEAAFAQPPHVERGKLLVLVGYLGDAGRPAIARLRAMVDANLAAERSKFEALTAAVALAHLRAPGDVVVPALVRLLAKEAKRGEAGMGGLIFLYVLPPLGRAQVEPPAIALTRDPDPHVRECVTVVLAMKQVAGSRGIDALVRLVREDPEVRVRDSAVAALRHRKATWRPNVQAAVTAYEAEPKPASHGRGRDLEDAAE